MNRYAEAEELIVLGLDAARRRFELPDPVGVAAEPAFILSAGWRSGSTLLQRMLTTDGRLMWGEPYAYSAVLRNTAAAWAPFDSTWPNERHFISSLDMSDGLASTWIANFYPDPSDLLAAQRAYLDTLFAVPATRAGSSSWGLKGVRLGGGVACFLQLLYPKARFVFLVRNPYDAYRSYLTKITRGANYAGWYSRWPDDRVAGPTHFGEVWRGLAESMQRHVRRVRAEIVRYEDLGAAGTIERLERLGLPVGREQLGQRVGSSFVSGDDGRALSVYEEQLLRNATGVLAEDFSYYAPSER